MARPTARGVLSIHTAIQDTRVSFNLLHPTCGSRVRNLVRGYEFEKGQFVQVTGAELDPPKAEANSNIELKEFIPIEKVDPVYFEDAHYLAPDEGGDKAYKLLADAMEKSGPSRIGQNG